MPRKGSAHFDEYSARTEVKHEIFEKYFRAYLGVLTRRVDACHYVDGFAGRGTYADGTPGSPLIAVGLLATHTPGSTVSLVESDPDTFAKLNMAVRASAGFDKLVDVCIEQGRFDQHIESILCHPIYRRCARVATFAFLDPCGVKGVRMPDIARLLSKPYAECLLFWNYDGLIRWLGNVRAGACSDSLVELFGSAVALKTAMDTFELVGPPQQRERHLRRLFAESIAQQCGAEFVLPFRFPAKDANRTAHYLIHCSRHGTAYKIMKEVMWKAGTTGNDSGTFEFVSESGCAVQDVLFDPPVLEEARGKVVEELRNGDRPVKLFTEEWVLRPGDRLIGRQYKQIILDLEQEQIVEVIDASSGQVKPGAQRLRSGATTLGSSLLIRLKRPGPA